MKKLINLQESLLKDIEKVQKEYHLGNMSATIRYLISVGLKKISEENNEDSND